MIEWMLGRAIRTVGTALGFLRAATLVGVIAVVPAIPYPRNAPSVPRLYLIAGQTIQALDPSTLAPILPRRGPVVPALRAGSQVVPSPNGSAFGSVQSTTNAARAMRLTIVNVRTNRVVQREVVGDFTLLGVSNDGREWYGTQTSRGGTVIAFVLGRFGQRHTLTFHLPQPCCLLLQYDARRDRLYSMSLGTTVGRNPPSPVLTVWQVGTRRRLGAVRTPLDLIAGTWWTGSQPHREIPGFALRPDGRRIAVLDEVNGRLDTMNALPLHVLSNPFIRGSAYESTSGPTTLFSPLLSGIPDGGVVWARFSPNGTILYEQGIADVETKRGGVVSEALPVQAIDVAHRRVRGTISAPLLSPIAVGRDGRSVYTVMASTRGTKRVVLVQRRNPITLAVVAQRGVEVSAHRYAMVALSR